MWVNDGVLYVVFNDNVIYVAFNDHVLDIVFLLEVFIHQGLQAYFINNTLFKLVVKTMLDF